MLRINRQDIQMYVLYEYYRGGGIYFPPFPQYAFGNNKQKKIVESINAILQGMPYKQLYMWELQNGQKMVIEKDSCLHGIMEFIEGRFPLPIRVSSQGTPYSYYSARETLFSALSDWDKQVIMTSVMQANVVVFDTPLWMQMYFAGYTQELTYIQEEVIRQKLYYGRGIDQIQQSIRIATGNNGSIQLEADLVIYLTYILYFEKFINSLEQHNFYMMQDLVFNQIRSGEIPFNRLRLLAEQFLQDRKKWKDPGLNSFLSGSPRPKWVHLQGIIDVILAHRDDMQARLFFEDFSNISNISAKLSNCDLTSLSLRSIILNVEEQIK